MSYTRTVENRPYDHMYDTTFVSNTRSRAYRASVRANPVNLNAEVAGSTRYKYFRRPVVPFMEAVPPEVVLAKGDGQSAGNNNPEEGDLLSSGSDPSSLVSGTTRSVEVQTLYRESEAQTDPYSPEYILKPGLNSTPEVLLLQHKKFGKGLPVGLREVQVIENARQKRAFEESLPPMTDEVSFEIRRRLMAKQEQLQFRRREEEIQELQDQRLALLEAALREKDREATYASEQRVEALRQRRIEQKDIAVAAIQRRRITHLRKLAQQRKLEEARIQKKPNKRDIIADYADYKSKVYAPKTRLGLLVDQQSSNYDSRQADIEPLTARDLTEAVPAGMLSSLIKAPPALRDVQRRSERLIDAQLEHMQGLINKERSGGRGSGDGSGEDKDASQPTWMKKRSKVQRPDTPSVDPEPDNGVPNAIVLLQRLLRGRAVQNMMFEGRSRKQALLRELRYEERIEDESREEARRRAEEQTAKELESAVQSTKDKIVGEVVSSTLSFLANHKVNSGVEARINEVAKRAQQERNRREAEESGRRQAEEMLRLRHDEMFRQLMQVHHETVDTFVDELLDGVSETAAAETAFVEITGQPPVGEAGADGAGDGEVVRDLVSSMVLPQVEREIVRQQVAAEERKFVDAAAGSVQQAVTN